ncbi:hypothetical protein GCM10025868_14540 [Angustibacter aerolatus]|uniref:ethanolamine-phosphate cytidylyltransferase n=1 Tax=Angustibacter aerolatus TaxID=1162965 RepID=A0ABQ6JEG9_9ACTN|nr:adenylyltransferase/cytidyltransferase family protein [Angustibacter aerolatus]GMA86204.1 hypothetical protein GCM10025868_14540 [Angustibacter aerolatus]
MSRIVGYAPGVYDLFHIGHLNILRHAAGLCDHLVAGVVSDEMALRAKGRAPVVPLAERLEIVQHIGFVDEAVAEDVPEKRRCGSACASTSSSRATTGGAPPRATRLEADFATVGVQVVYFPYTAHTSSTQAAPCAGDPQRLAPSRARRRPRPTEVGRGRRRAGPWAGATCPCAPRPPARCRRRRCRRPSPSW